MKRVLCMTLVLGCSLLITSCKPPVLTAALTSDYPQWSADAQTVFQDKSADDTMEIEFYGKTYRGTYNYSYKAGSGLSMSFETAQLDYYTIDDAPASKYVVPEFAVHSKTHRVYSVRNVTIYEGPDVMTVIEKIAAQYIDIDMAEFDQETYQGQYTYTGKIGNLLTAEQLVFYVSGGKLNGFCAYMPGEFDDVRKDKDTAEIIEKLTSDEAMSLMETTLKNAYPKENYPHVDEYKVTDTVLILTEKEELAIVYTVEFTGYGEGPAGELLDGFEIVKKIVVEYT